MYELCVGAGVMVVWSLVTRIGVKSSRSWCGGNEIRSSTSIVDGLLTLVGVSFQSREAVQEELIQHINHYAAALQDAIKNVLT